MKKTEPTKLFILKIYNPIIGAVKTYRNDNRTMKIGSDAGCDLQIMLPSLRQVHIIADAEERKVTAVGNDVHCDNVPLAPGTSMVFTNSSIIRVHNILMMFFVADSVEELAPYDDKIIQEASRFKEYSPVLRIEHNTDTLGNSIEDDKSVQRDNRDAIDIQYERELGDISRMKPVEKEQTGYEIPGTNINVDASEPQSTGSMALDRAKMIFEEEYKVSSSPEILEAVIHKKLDDIKDEVKEMLTGDINIPVVRKPQSDLGEIAVDNDLLVQAKKEAHDQILSAEIGSLEQLKTSITDNIKEEIREEIVQLVQEQAKSNVEREVEECLQSPKFVDVIVKTADIVKQRAALAEGEKEIKSTPEQDDTGSEGAQKVKKGKNMKKKEEDDKIVEKEIESVKRRKTVKDEAVEDDKKDDKAVKEDDKTLKKEDKAVKKEDKAVKKEDKAVKKEDKTLKKEDKAVKKEDKTLKKDDKAVKKEDKTLKKEDKAVKKDDKTLKKEDKAVKEDDKAVKKEDKPKKTKSSNASTGKKTQETKNTTKKVSKVINKKKTPEKTKEATKKAPPKKKK